MITTEAKERCSKPLADQLDEWREAEERRLASSLATLKRRRSSGDWDDVDAAFKADRMKAYKRGFE